MIYDHVGAMKDPFNQDLAAEFWRSQKKVISIFTKHGPRIKHTIQKIIYWGPSFSLLEIRLPKVGGGGDGGAFLKDYMKTK